jgi:hypothetical protein
VGDLDGLDDALLGRDPTDEAQALAAAAIERRIVEAQAVVDDAFPGHRGMRAGLVVADGDQTARRVTQQSLGPGQVQPPMERGDDRRG